jgi:hypothetical protein
MATVTLQKLLNNNTKAIKSHVVRDVDMHRTISILTMKSGTVYVETSVIDDEGIETIELLFSTDRKHFKIIGRRRLGEAHNAMRSYTRDSELPMYSTVRM